MARPTRVFVTYTHDSEEHKSRVLALANLLRSHGLDVRLDAWDAYERKDWYVWGQRQIMLADYIVVVASARYKMVGDGDVAADENRGAQAEVTALREMFQQDRPEWTRRVLPVLLPGHTADEIPLFLQPRTADHYRVKDITTAGADSLIRVLTQQPATVPVASTADPEPPLTASQPNGLTQVNNASEGGTVFAVQAGDLHVPYQSEIRTDRPEEARWARLTEPVLPQWHDLKDTPGALELHLIPVDGVDLIPARRLERMPEELAALGRQEKLFTMSEGIATAPGRPPRRKPRLNAGTGQRPGS